MTRRKKTIGWILIAAIVVAAIISIVVGVSEGVPETDPASSSESSTIRDSINSAGSWGPVVFTLTQSLQAIVAPIPGPVITITGGYLYGGGVATLLSILGSAIGFFVVFVISKKVGRPLLIRYLKPKRLKKYEQIMAARGRLFLYLAFLIPILPDSIIGYLAGLSNLPIKNLLVIATVGRAPSIIMSAYIGSSAAAANYTITIIGLAIFAVTSIAFYLYREPFEGWLLKNERPKD